MDGLDLGQLVWCWPVYVVTDDSCCNCYEVVGGSYVVVGLANAMDDAMAISVRHWVADDLLMDEGRNYVERGCGIIWIYTAWATVVCDLGACSGSHDMVVCILFGRLCWFWLAERISGLVMHTTMVFMSMVGFSAGFGATMLL